MRNGKYNLPKIERRSYKLRRTGDFEIAEVKEADLPPVMKGMTAQEKVKYVDTKKKKRQKIQKEIIELNKKREDYVRKQKVENSSETALDDAMLKAIKTQAKSKNFKFE